MTKVTRHSRKINLNDNQIECGDLAREIGKFYMEDLRSAIQDGRKFDLDKLWFICKFEKNPTDKRKMHLKLAISSIPLVKMRESFDLWMYDYKKEVLQEIWSLPHRCEMMNYLYDPSLYHPKLIQWIREYIKQENINLSKIKTKLTSSHG